MESTLPRPSVGFRPALALAALSGLAYFLAFPGIELWPLGFVALVPLIVALRGQPPQRAALLGWVAGFCMTMTGFYWLLEMLRVFSGFPTLLCLLFMAILCAYQAGRIAFAGFLYARAEQRGWPSLLVFAAAFATSEQVFPLLFPWYYGAVLHQVPALAQVAELGGPILVGLVLIAPNLAFAELIQARLDRRRPALRSVAALLLVPCAVALYGVVRIGQVDRAVAAAPRARVGLVQANMSLLGKRRNKHEGLMRHMDLTQELLRQGPLDLVVWSETSVMSSAPEADAAEIYRRSFTERLGVPAIFGAVLVRPVDDARRYVLFNSALASSRDGSITGRYDKQFLLAFGEYLPFGDQIPYLYELSPNSGRFTAGTSLEPLAVNGHEVATFICYEDISPGFVRSIVGNGKPDLLVNLTNDAWFGDTTQPWIHLALSKFRAIEHRRFFVRSTNSGVSAFIDPVGRVLSHTQTFQPAALRADLAWLDSSTPYELWGDAPWWLVGAATIAAGFVRRRRAPSAPSASAEAPTARSDQPT